MAIEKCDLAKADDAQTRLLLRSVARGIVKRQDWGLNHFNALNLNLKRFGQKLSYLEKRKIFMKYKQVRLELCFTINFFKARNFSI